MGLGNKRNLPCICGSGKKYKKCHLYVTDKVVEEEQKSSYSETDKALLEMKEKLNLEAFVTGG